MAGRILIVDDDPSLLKVLSMRLERAGYEVDTAADGFAGLEKVRRDRPNLIILDLMLPEVDGCKVCRMLKFDHAYQNIPIIVLTVKNRPEDRLQTMEAGASAYFTKPYASEELLDEVDRQLTLTGAGAPDG